MPPILEPNLRHLYALVVVHRLGSVSAAAPQVNLSQPALTQAVARLEQQLGVRLFDRHPGGMVATEATQLLVPRIERALEQLGRGIRVARRALRLPARPGLERRVSLGQLQALIAVDVAGSYSLAAARAGVSQPAIYRAVQALAEVIEVPLTVRRGKTMQPTPVAVRLLRQVRLALAELRAGLDEVAALRSQHAGRLTLGVMPLARAILLPQVLARFVRAHPGASVNVVEGPYAELLAHLRDGELDLLIGALREPLPVRDVLQETLFDDAPVIVARSGHPLAGQAYAFAQLLEYPWVIATTGTPVRARWEQMFRDQGIEPPALRIECGAELTIRGLLLEDDWLTLMSRDQFLFERRAGLLCEIGATGPQLRRQIGMTLRSDWHPTRAQSAFVQTLRQVCAERVQPADAHGGPFRYCAPISGVAPLRSQAAQSESESS
ncbi:LysR substrate-binding domain-containing protein [Xanthomonas hortorum]|uniref:HTH lysR-type domain-containing protein n=1 Tax=Xanthomonas hortorum pv. pelargonii TaxID=453602 RepID=A0A6V7F2W8_9XANT|nr:LysR substrate-binding domain-containing protein [Xanthomonas hortorum]MCE4352994.1 LysR family transcriptional regulator [Xanthomonas hortorum pv. pelargonii]MCM5524580.1 LysR family transcriptional regulator [Xanthomonas hortorum pv. pelargonii]MCM5537105.1 LysR family transcriptional regulator [Xanthomonas hortorum pv. pelargonii]MCM5541217.1 LysR family transcriptional regulator [Xanthomonas hortorum pv. pelargonii]MCM5545193.1 LysR family transcriptional regulator [Xanthomonas hortorum